MAPTTAPRLTLATIRRARDRFRKGTAGDLFYRAALHLIASSRRPSSDLDLAESIAVLLQTWNREFYRFRGGFTETDTVRIRRLLDKYQAPLKRFQKRRFDYLTPADGGVIRRMFQDFEIALGPVGAAKALHLLAPEFFPLWDGRIAKDGYGIRLKAMGQNGENYALLMSLTLAQIEQLGGWERVDGNVVKAIDELNYCYYTREWSF